MAKHRAFDWSSFWYLALAEPLGLWIKCPDPARTKSLLNTAKRATNDPHLSDLQLRTDPSDVAHGLWIVNPNGVPND